MTGSHSSGAVTAVLFLVGSACAPAPDARVAEEESAAELARPSYSVRLDSESSSVADFRLIEDDDGIRIQTGPAGIAYRADDVVSSGDFALEATFIQYDAPLGYREAFGIFVGGSDLDGPDQEYTYLLVRTTGDWLVKRRIGAVTETIVDWTPGAAVSPVRAEGDVPVNVLAVRITGPDTHFIVNGESVHTAATSRVRPHGMAGVRVNHRLDVRVDGWALIGASDS